MKALRRLVFILVIGLLIAAVPVSATASESWVKGAVRDNETQFDRQLTQSIATGLDPARADQLMWRYSQVVAVQPRFFWQAPAVQHQQLVQLQQLHADLSASYQQSLAEQRDGFQRGLRQWDALLLEAAHGGVTTEDVSDTRTHFAAYAGTARTPNEFRNLAQVLAAGLPTSFADHANRTDHALRSDHANRTDHANHGDHANDGTSRRH